MSHRRKLSFEDIVAIVAPDTKCPPQPCDTERLATALQRVRRALESGGEWTLERLADYAGCSAPGASARLRQLRGHPYRLTIHKRRSAPGSGLYLYWLDPRP